MPQSTKPSATGAESPTTAREPDFDDDVHDHNASLAEPAPSPTPKRVSFQEQPDEVPPTKPPRPLSSQAQAENTLYEAFPSIDSKVVKAVLVASGYKVEPAFNALLSTQQQSPAPTLRANIAKACPIQILSQKNSHRLLRHDQPKDSVR
jgi:hypothetical protein